MLVFLCRASKSRRNAPPHSSNSVMPNPAFFCAQTWLLVVWISQQSTGLFSSILQMIQKYEALFLSLSDSNRTFSNINFSISNFPPGIHPSRWSNGPWRRQLRSRPVNPSTGRTRIPEIFETSKSATERIRILVEQSC